MNTEKDKVAKKPLSVSSVIEMAGNMVESTRMTWRESKSLVILLLAATVLMTAMSFLRSGANGLVVNELTKSGLKGVVTSDLAMKIGLLMLAYALPEIMSALRRYWEKRMHMIMSERFEMMILKKRSELDLARHEDPEFQDLTNRAGERGIFSMINLMESQYELFASIVSLVIASTILLSIDGRLWIIVAIGEIPSLIAQFKYSHNVWDIYDTQSAVRRKFFHLRNKFNGQNSLFELQVFRNARHFLGLVGKMLKDFNDEHKKNDRKKFRADVLAHLVSTLAIGTSMIIIIMKVVNGDMQVGTWLFIAATLFSFQNSFSALFNGLARQYENSLFVTDIRKVLATKPMIERPTNGIKVCSGKIPTVTLENVTFAYPGQTTPVLKDVSLTIRPGEILAIVGENGVGKTTLAKLLCRVYDPQYGRILIDGVDLKEIDLDSWYESLALLGQVYGEYMFTVDEVIGLGRTDVPLRRGDVLQAAQFSGADGFIEQLPNQYSQQLGREFGGVDLSKGQNQRMALSRCIYREPQFAILDEPTAATDAKAEAAIFERLYSRRGKASVVLVSHNYANVVKADRICVIEKGMIIELGSHAELMEKEGVYARLFRLQADRFQD